MHNKYGLYNGGVFIDTNACKEEAIYLDHRRHVNLHIIPFSIRVNAAALHCMKICNTTSEICSAMHLFKFWFWDLANYFCMEWLAQWILACRYWKMFLLIWGWQKLMKSIVLSLWFYNMLICGWQIVLTKFIAFSVWLILHFISRVNQNQYHFHNAISFQLCTGFYFWVV